MILAIDPGNQKCGLAVVGMDQILLYKTIVPTNRLIPTVEDLLKQYSIVIIIIGDRTKSEFVRQSLLPLGLPIEMVDENRSSMEGRYRYLRENSHGWRRLLPIGLRTPDKPYDDYVAVVLAERYLRKVNKSG